MGRVVIRRKENEKIYIGDDVEIFISKISGRRVDVAITAPEKLKIRRGEFKESKDKVKVKKDGI